MGSAKARQYASRCVNGSGVGVGDGVMVGVGVRVGVGVGVGGFVGSGVGDGVGVDDGVTVGTSVACATVFHNGMVPPVLRVSPSVVVHANNSTIASDTEIAATLQQINV